MATSLPVSVLDSLKCPICLDYAENAVETDCCAQVYCQKCVKDLLGKDCPSCRNTAFKTCVSKITRKVVGELPVECPNSCEEKVTKSTLASHEVVCPKRECVCPVENCDFSGLFDHMIEHASEKHKKDIFVGLQTVHAEKVHIHSQTEEVKVYNCPFAGCEVRPEMSRNHLEDHIFEYHARSFRWFREILQPKLGPITIINSEGRNASMSPNGKFYCGEDPGAYVKGDEEKKVKRIACKYDNKLNCRSCMKLDVTLRNLPHGFLVNGAGAVAKPQFCTHEVKGSEYFSSNTRQPLCYKRTCGETAKYFCGELAKIDDQNQKCGSGILSHRRYCDDCVKLSYVFEIRRNNTDVEYYRHVWEKP